MVRKRNKQTTEPEVFVLTAEYEDTYTKAPNVVGVFKSFETGKAACVQAVFTHIDTLACSGNNARVTTVVNPGASYYAKVNSAYSNNRVFRLYKSVGCIME